MYLRSQRPTTLGFFQSIVGYFRLWQPLVLGYLAFQASPFPDVLMHAGREGHELAELREQDA